MCVERVGGMGGGEVLFKKKHFKVRTKEEKKEGGRETATSKEEMVAVVYSSYNIKRKARQRNEKKV